MQDDNVQNRIQELIAELSECREDERTTQNQILEIISISGAILGLLFGTSYIAEGDRNQSFTSLTSLPVSDIPWIGKYLKSIMANITNTRIIFGLSLLVFCIAFSYITVLGIGNILRYYYIQNLEDRLYTLSSNTPDNEDRGTFIHWNAFSAPIITRNTKHITSSHTLLYFSLYTISTVLVITFSMGIIFSLFIQISPRKWIDILSLAIVLFFMIFTLFLFFRLSSHTKEIVQFLWDTAHQNQKVRLGKSSLELYQKGYTFRRILKYLIYPKTQDLQKPALIILGFIYGVLYMEKGIEIQQIFHIVLVLFVFDILAYQARYQINDIRGIEEDIEIGAKNRLISNILRSNEQRVDIYTAEVRHIIKISSVIAILKFVLAIFMVVLCGGKIKGLLLWCIGLLVVSTIVYEYVRAKKKIKLVFIFVGAGYPLRFFLGFLTVMPEKIDLLLNIVFICLLIALWLYGACLSALVWADEVAKRMQRQKKDYGEFPSAYKKKHFEYIQDIIKMRFEIAEQHMNRERVLPLREKGKIKDPWNLLFALCIISLTSAFYFLKIPTTLLIIKIIESLVGIMSIFVSNKRKIVLFGIEWILIIIMGIVTSKMCILYYLLLGIQLLISFTFFLLSYQPQLKPFSLNQSNRMKVAVVSIILGKYVAEILIDSKKKNSE